MPIHDWTKVEAGIFHDFHSDWIQVLKRALNSGLLPPQYYALSEQKAGGVGPDVLTLEAESDDDAHFYRKMQRILSIRCTADDRVVVAIEIDLAPLLTVSASYECKDAVAAYVEPVGVGDALPDMPLFLVPGGHVLVPLEATYQTAWMGVPVRWRKVIDQNAAL